MFFTTSIASVSERSSDFEQSSIDFVEGDPSQIMPFEMSVCVLMSLLTFEDVRSKIVSFLTQSSKL